MGDRGWVAREGTGFLIGKDRLVRTSMSNYIEGRIFFNLLFRAHTDGDNFCPS